MIEKEIGFMAGKLAGKVSAIFVRPENARWLLAFAPGAGAGIRHPFMSGMAYHLAKKDIASFRYQFPYREQGKRAPDPLPVLLETVRSAITTAQEYGRGLPLLAGGKSLGGRMTSTAASQDQLPGVKGLVFFGFPLHAPGKPSGERGEHLFKIRLPMLFLQGTRDPLAELALMRPLCDRLQKGGPVRLQIIDGADHSFQVPKKSGKTDEEVWEELARVVSEWTSDLEHDRKRQPREKPAAEAFGL